MRISPHPVRSWLFVLIVVGLLSLAWQHQSRAAAQEPPDKQQTQTTLMEAMQRDAQAAQPLAPMSMTPCSNGFAGAYPCSRVDLLAFMPLASIGGGNGNDIWGWTDSLTNKEYALVGRSNGTSFVDISNPENPIYLGNLPTHTNNSIWRDIKVYANYAFIVSEASGHGIQIFDLKQLRDPSVLPITFSETAHFSGFGSAHNIVINENTGYAYGVGTNTCGGGLHMVNIQTPTSPINAGCFSGDGYTHDAQCVVYHGPDIEHQGQEICFNSNEDTLTIVDVTNKAAPVQLSRTGYAGSVYTHQGWLTEDHAHFLLGDELDESGLGHNTRTYIWDINNLDAPTLIGSHTATTAAIDHNMYVKEAYVYQSNYRAGLRILNLDDIANGNLVEKAYFDIYPSNDNANYNGSWSNYPYFDSGIVIINGIEQGLFIVRPQLTPIYDVLLSSDAAATGAPGATVIYTVQITNTGDSPDTFTIDTSSNWTTNQSMSSVALNSEQSTTFNISVDIPLDAVLKESDTTTVTATSHGDDSVVAITYLTTMAAADHDVAIGSSNPAQMGRPGEAVTYTLHITNTGNVTDTFMLGSIGADWATAVSPVTVTIPSLAETTAIVTVTIPLTATNDMTNTIGIQATAVDYPQATATTYLTTTAVFYAHYLPIIQNAYTPPQEIACTDGMAGIYPCKNVNYLSFMSLTDLGAGVGEKAANVWGWTDPETGSEYVLLGMTDRLTFVDATDPINPSVVGFLPNQTITNPVKYRDVKVYQHYAFVIADEQSHHGMQVFDLNQLRDVTTPPVTFAANAYYDEFGNAHNIFINEDTGYAYIVRNTAPQLCSSAVYMMNLQDPLNPAFAGCYDVGGAVSDTMCVVYHGPDATYQGHELCLVASDDEILVADVTNKSNPSTLATLTYPNIQRAHLAWLTEDHRYFVSSDMNDEMMLGLNTRIFIWDFTQVTAPLLKSIYTGSTPASDHNVWVRGRYAYVGNFRAGVRILDLQDIDNTTLNNVTITEAAYFDLYPDNDNTGHIGGAWAVYAFFESGVIAVSDKEAGLYLLRPLLP